MYYIDTHTHIDGEEFKDDLDATITRAKEAGAIKLLIPGINLDNIQTISSIVNKYPNYCYGMIGLHPEDVKENYKEVIGQMKEWTHPSSLNPHPSSLNPHPSTLNPHPSTFRPIAIGEIGLDFYWSREYEQQQLDAFQIQVRWAIEENLPLMIHCRKAQNEMVKILRQISSSRSNSAAFDKAAGNSKNSQLITGVFHCFTGNEIEAEELLSFPGFFLGIGGVLTFKKSNLPKTLPAVVPLERIVLETDSPYMAPVPHRGERNESSFIPYIIQKLAESYAVSPDEVAEITTYNAKQLFHI